VCAVGSFYGIGPSSSIPLGFDDAIWIKYGVVELLNLKDANGRPYTRNVFNSPTEADGHLLSQGMGVPALAPFGGAIVAASIPGLQKMGRRLDARACRARQRRRGGDRHGVVCTPAARRDRRARHGGGHCAGAGRRHGLQPSVAATHMALKAGARLTTFGPQIVVAAWR